jgi:cell wall-associated NlpC family hydrolase
MKVRNTSVRLRYMSAAIALIGSLAAPFSAKHPFTQDHRNFVHTSRVTPTQTTASNAQSAQENLLQSATSPHLASNSSVTATSQAEAIVKAAEKWVSSPVTPYCWYGGSDTGPTHGDGEVRSEYIGPPGQSGCYAKRAKGFDCSGLVKYSIFQALGISLGHTVADEANGITDRGARIAPKIISNPNTANLQPGDIVVFGRSRSDLLHDGIYVGGDKIVNAYDYKNDGDNGQNNRYWGVAEMPLPWITSGFAFEEGVRYWTEKPLTQPLGYLSGVTAISATDAWAVGAAFDGTQERGLIEHWDGSAWQQVASPAPGKGSKLVGVSATSARQIWAVGAFIGSKSAMTLTERWNGTSWEQVPSPSPAGGLFEAVAATSSTNAWAVGFFDGSQSQEPLIDHWNGAAWKQVASVTPASGGFLTGVAVSSPLNAWAVGATAAGEPLIEHWNGTAWEQMASPVPYGSGSFYAVTSISANDAWAVGQAGADEPLIEHWNGKDWTTVASPQPAGGGRLADITAISPSNAWAVGSTGQADDTSLIEHWDGRAWRRVTSPSPPPGGNLFEGVAATSPSNAWAVGTTNDQFDSPMPMIARWNGIAWK